MRKGMIFVVGISIAVMFCNMSCCKKCCSPSIEVGLFEKASDYCPQCGNLMLLYTWSDAKLMEFPTTADQLLTSNTIKTWRPHVAKVKVTNFSDISVRAINVEFMWASPGIVSTGTPVGTVCLDLDAKKSGWVVSPPFIAFSPLFGATDRHCCLGVRIFHPCDSDLDNNRCWKNLTLIVIPWPWKYYVVPFFVNLPEFKGRLDFKIDAPPGINVKVVKEDLKAGAMDKMSDVSGIKEAMLREGEEMKYNLVIENAGADLKSGDTFDVVVQGITAEGKILGTYTVQVKIR